MSKLFSELQIGTMTLKNRTFMAPMSLGYESEDGTVNEVLKNYWVERAKGGVGCIILDAVSVDPRVPYLGNTLSFRGPESIEKYKSFTELIHSYGTKVIPQITHPGPESVSAFYGVPPMASSCYVNAMGQKTRALKLEEIPGIIEQYAQTAYQAKSCGFDGIELHCAHAYMLLGSFLSPMRNKRTDTYGGSLMNRARLLFEVIDAIKEKCGKDFPLILRISGSERDEQGNTVEDIKHLVKKLIEHGVDAFEVSGGTQYERPNKIIPCHGEKEVLNLEEAMEIKKISTVPVIVVGKILDPVKAMDIVDQGSVDGVVFGRALLSDPNLVKKAECGAWDEIAPCAACGIGCIGQQMKRKPATCVINPFLGREGTLTLKEAEESKKIVVVGAGIAGLAAARALTLRGHKVTVLEKEEVSGGQMNDACAPPHKQEISKWMVYLNSEMRRLNVDIKYSVEATPESVTDLHPDAVVVATGASEFLPPIKGIQKETAITARKVLSHKNTILGGNVLVVGGGMVGMEVCEHLLHHSRGPLSITMMEMADSIGGGMIPNNLKPMMTRLRSSGVQMMPSTKLLAVSNSHVTMEHGGIVREVPGFTHVVYACGSVSENNLYKDLKNQMEEVYCIGDASGVRQALDAVREGVEIAVSI